jgi:hypothetical protein
MPNVMHHTHQPHHVHHHLSWYFLVGLVIAFGMILILSIMPTITIPAPAINPMLYRESAYLEYLRGEKVMYTNPIELNAALTAYHAGEKVLYDHNSATWAYHLGEKNAMLDIKALNAEDALFAQRMGEKGIK